MARRRRAPRRERARQYLSRAARRRPRRNDTMRELKKVGKGTALGLAISIPLTLAAKYTGQPILMEAGQRIGSIASSIWGSSGNAGYQLADAIADRVVFWEGNTVTGTQGAVRI